MPMIEVPRLNYLEVSVSIQDKGFANRPPIDLTDARVIFTVKEYVSDDEALVRIQKDNVRGGIEIVNPEKGEVVVTLTPGDLKLPPSDYRYDIFVIRGDRVHSCEPDIFRVKPTVLGVLP